MDWLTSHTALPGGQEDKGMTKAPRRSNAYVLFFRETRASWFESLLLVTIVTHKTIPPCLLTKKPKVLMIPHLLLPLSIIPRLGNLLPPSLYAFFRISRLPLSIPKVQGRVIALFGIIYCWYRGLLINRAGAARIMKADYLNRFLICSQMFATYIYNLDQLASNKVPFFLLHKKIGIDRIVVIFPVCRSINS